MKSESNTKPTLAYAIDRRGDLADISFFENIEETIDESGEVKWSYDHYLLTVDFRPDLHDLIDDAYDDWLAMARATETTPTPPEPTEADRLAVLEMAMLEIIMGGLS